MHPTTDEQLAGARRLLDQTLQDPDLSPASLALVTNARRLLTQVERSWHALPAFYRSDNSDLIALLSSVRSFLAQPGLDDLDALIPETDDDQDPARRNVRLRALLTETIGHLPSTPEGRAVRLQISDHLRGRTDSDPSQSQHQGRPR